MEGLSDEANYPWESQKKVQLRLVNPIFATEEKKVLIHQLKGNLQVFQNHSKQAKINVVFIIFHL